MILKAENIPRIGDKVANENLKPVGMVFDVFGPVYKPFSFMIEAPGAFVALGLMLCLMNLVGKK